MNKSKLRLVVVIVGGVSVGALGWFLYCLPPAESASSRDPNTLTALANLAAVVLAQKRAADVEALLREALPGMERKLGKDHFYTAGTRISLAKALPAQNRFAEAETELIEAQRVLSQAQGVSPSRQRRCLESLVALYQGRDKAQPGQGCDLKAAEWSQKLASLGKWCACSPMVSLWMECRTGFARITH
jgi:hypothetical protein